MALLRQCRLFDTEAGRGNFSMTDLLQKAAKTYREICKKQYRYTLNNGQCVHIVFRPQNFVHLAGLRKLSDLYEFQPPFSAVNIYRSILRGDITMFDLQRSIHFDSDAKERVENLCRLEEVLQTKKIVWGFDHTKTYVRTKLKSTVILFKDDGFNFFLMLGVAEEGATYYPETFFLRYDAAYIKNQTIVEVNALEIIASPK